MTQRIGGHANRGRQLELLIAYVNAQYRNKGLAIIHKVPTAWIPLRGMGGKITGAKVEEPAAVDFIGLAGRVAIAFDAKQTSEPRIRWDRVEPHQGQFLDEWERQGGQAFVLVGFYLNQALPRCFMIPWSFWQYFWRGKGEAKASISLATLLDKHPYWEVTASNGIVLDYLKAVKGEITVERQRVLPESGE